ncbi:hypothetical protein QIS99_13920 [Streptomyces sp. B-S-A8]|uniref:Uncharacterized protein n=1 Tax=Streptomyces solicavernae TaxID=3043614 RepID=A0ABT6RS71_9ACTN|nr:hypothetical protein [Streptomyces sp. B-S-A8]MDI3387291.1 hypothetical protein [Streptomyces sp. B-S-A8]
MRKPCIGRGAESAVGRPRLFSASASAWASASSSVRRPRKLSSKAGGAGPSRWPRLERQRADDGARALAAVEDGQAGRPEEGDEFGDERAWGRSGSGVMVTMAASVSVRVWALGETVTGATVGWWPIGSLLRAGLRLDLARHDDDPEGVALAWYVGCSTSTAHGSCGKPVSRILSGASS